MHSTPETAPAQAPPAQAAPRRGISGPGLLTAATVLFGLELVAFAAPGPARPAQAWTLFAGFAVAVILWFVSGVALFVSAALHRGRATKDYLDIYTAALIAAFVLGYGSAVLAIPAGAASTIWPRIGLAIAGTAALAAWAPTVFRRDPVEEQPR